MISFDSHGDFGKTDNFFKKMMGQDFMSVLDHYGKQGVSALASATPRESGETANSWSYEVVKENGRYAVYWRNSHVNEGVVIAVILQYGHGTKNGGYVQGRDYINPAIRPVFDKISQEAWKAVTG